MEQAGGESPGKIAEEKDGMRNSDRGVETDFHSIATRRRLPAGPSRYRAYGEGDDDGTSLVGLACQMLWGLAAVVATVALLTMFGG